MTPLRSAVLDRQCFRLTFADGRVLKGRHVEALEQADRLEALTARLDPRSFPPLLARRGRALLTAWVDGTPLDRLRSWPAAYRACGGLHAVLHRTRVDPRPEWRRRHGDWRARLASFLRALVDAGRLGAAEATRAEALAVSHEPRHVSLGLCHGDLCPENIVVDHDGRVVVVDNDSLAVNAYGFDLARTWYRWPMSEGRRNGTWPGTMPRFPHLASRLVSGRYAFQFSRRELSAGHGPVHVAPAEAWSLTPGQYCELVGTDAVESAPLRAIVFPRLDDEATSITLQATALAEATPRIASSVFRTHRPEAFFVGRNDACPVPDGALEARCAALAAGSVTYDCRLGARVAHGGTGMAGRLRDRPRLPFLTGEVIRRAGVAWRRWCEEGRAPEKACKPGSVPRAS